MNVRAVLSACTNGVKLRKPISGVKGSKDGYFQPLTPKVPVVDRMRSGNLRGQRIKFLQDLPDGLTRLMSQSARLFEPLSTSVSAREKVRTSYSSSPLSSSLMSITIFSGLDSGHQLLRAELCPKMLPFMKPGVDDLEIGVVLL